MIDGPRPVRREELNGVIELIRSIFDADERVCLDIAQRFPHALSPQNAANIIALFADGRPASAIVTETADLVVGPGRMAAGMLGMVGTAADQRGRGYAGQVLEATCDHLRRRGTSLALISGGRSLYTLSGGARVWPIVEAVGDRPAIRSPGATDRPARTGRLSVPSDKADRLTLEPVSAANRAELIALHDAEPVRFDWAAAWRDVVLPGLLETAVGAGFLVRRAGRTAAAACILRPFMRGGPHQLLDWFGDRRAVAESLGAMMDALGAERMTSRVSVNDVAMLDALASAGLALKPWRPSSWTLRVLDIAALLAGLEPYLRERLGDNASAVGVTGDGHLRLRAGGAEHVAVGVQAAARVLFAMSDDPAGDPLAGALAAVHDLAARVFPVPLRHYGLNYL